MRLLRAQRGTVGQVTEPPVGLDIKASPYTTLVGSISDPAIAAEAMRGVTHVFHAATLHKPHIATHSQQDFLDTNVSGTLCLLEAAKKSKVSAFVFTSTTSVFGDALRPAKGEPAAWITESTVPRVKNIYGATKLAAEDLCRLYHRNHGLNCIVLRTSRFFPEEDDDAQKQAAYAAENLKANEYLYRRVDIEDAANAHFCAAQSAASIGHDTFIISATTPFSAEDLAELGNNATTVVERLFPTQKAIYAKLDYQLLPTLDRVYVNSKARNVLGWQPTWDFARVLDALSVGQSINSKLAQDVGKKGYHSQTFSDGPYPTLDS